MTAIAGIVADDGRVWIGGDSAGTAGYAQHTRSDVKVFRNGPYLFGFTTSFRMGQLLHYALKPPPPPDDPRRTYGFLVTEFVDAVRACLNTGGMAHKRNEVETGGTFLLGLPGALYFVDSDYQVGIPTVGYEAVGCGDAVALGSLHTTAALRWTPRRRLVAALLAATEHNAGVGPPFVIRTTGRP